MGARDSLKVRSAVCVCLAFLLGSCATAPKERGPTAEEDIATILSEPLDADEYGQTLRCLNSAQWRDIRILDDKHILFRGSRGRLWLNTLRMRCPDLRWGDVLRVKTTSATGRICNLDSFEVRDWFDWPWYRRWGRSWSGTRCTLGDFQPVSEAQVAAIREALDRR